MLDKSNMDDIVSLAENHNTISLIKKYCELSGLGLKDSKFAVDACKKEGCNEIDIDAIKALFAPYVVGGIEEGLAKGIDIATENWSALGFEDPAQLYEIVARNFKKMYARRRAQQR